ncbi:MAG: hypothetical protein QG553_886 [Patescibacteria group bacterium]|nr:hypothetical protein [Patescibacteria group bacterium]
MIYKELLRVAEIDAEINALHDKLGQLYAERQDIIIPQPVADNGDQVRQAYQLLEEQWGMLGATIPRFDSLQPRLQKAVAIREQLLADHPSLADKLVITLVPPQRSLQKCYQAQPDVPSISLADDIAAKQSRRWTLLVVIEAPQYLADNNLRGFMERQDYLYQEHDCRALGLQELMAYGLQTGLWPQADSWTLLLKDADDQQVLCAQLRNDVLVVDRDEQDSLLGRNYFKPAIAVN